MAEYFPCNAILLGIIKFLQTLTPFNFQPVVRQIHTGTEVWSQLTLI